MGFFKPTYGKNNVVKDRLGKSITTTQPVVADKGKGKKTIDNVNVQTPFLGQSEKKSYLPPYKPRNSDLISKEVSYKQIVDKKLTILLIENTVEVAKQKDSLIKIIKSLVSSGLVSVINYGSTVKQSETFDVTTFYNIDCLRTEDIGDTACLYDALMELSSLISKKYMYMEEKEKVRINKIEVIGIGTCKDNGSKTSKEVVIDCFCKAIKKPEVITKYFCLTEETFMDAAEIGFHSIGAISRNY